MNSNCLETKMKHFAETMAHVTKLLHSKINFPTSNSSYHIKIFFVGYFDLFPELLWGVAKISQQRASSKVSVKALWWINSLVKYNKIGVKHKKALFFSSLSAWRECIQEHHMMNRYILTKTKKQRFTKHMTHTCINKK